MEYGNYVLPGNQWQESLFLGDGNSILIQKIQDGILLHEFRGDELIREKIIDELGSERRSKAVRLGEAEGEDFSHCLFLAQRHSNGFLERVTGYHTESPKQPGARVRYDFYAPAQV